MTLGVAVALLGATVAVLLAHAPASADETTAAQDSLRTGWDQSEPGLAPSSVAASDFGQQFSATVTGQVYAQPLIAGGTLVAATEANDVYGLDPATGQQRWTRALGPAWPAATLSCGDLTPTIGVTSTPVYDPATGDVYLTTKVNDGPDAAHPHWYLHALDAATGAERAGFPVVIQGAAANSPLFPFNPETLNQRPALLLLGGVVYLGFGSTCDATPYVGYVVGVDDMTGRQTAMWSTEANSSDEAGIWQAGGGLVSDGPGRVFVATGNGVAPAPGPGDTPPATLGESVVRLGVGTDGALTPQSFFSPHDNLALNQDDADLGSGGPMALPPSFGTAAHPRLLVQVGKDGRVYLLDADHLGGSAQGTGGGDAALGVSGPFNGVWGHPAFWGGDGGYVYVADNAGPLRALRYASDGTTPSLTSVGTSASTFPYSSGSPVVTSSGTTSGSALVWIVWSSGPAGTGAQLRAYDAVPVNGVLTLRYSAPIGTAAKFAVPATDGSRVYVGTRDGHVLAFGRPTTSPLTAKPYDFGATAVGTTATAQVTVTATTAVTVTGASAPAPFSLTASVPSTALPAGQSLTVPVRYAPATWGAATGTLTITTSAGPVALDLHGSGTQPGLGADPAAIDFGQVRTGSSGQLGVNIVNTGTQPETITGVTAPTAPFTATTLPHVGDTLAAGASAVVPLVYTPTTATGTEDTTSLVVTGSEGTVTVPLRGLALTGQPVLTLAPANVDFGIVPVGQPVTRTFTVTNTGTVPLTITKAKAPTGVFTSATPLPEGQVLAPGDSITQGVTYTPADAYPATARYLVTGNDGLGEQAVTLVGNNDPIGAYLASLGGSRGSGLGNPVSAQYVTANGGRAQDFTFGGIFWSPATGAHVVRGAILAHYQSLGGPGGVLGYPTTDEIGTPDGTGRFNHFLGQDGSGASVYWTQATGAHEVHGAIRAEWAATGWEAGPLGYPTTDESVTPDGVGRYNHFSKAGSVYWTASTGAHEVHGSIRAEWAATGWEAGPLGYPTTDESVTPDGVGRYNHFSKSGSVYWTASTGAHEVHGSIRAEWAATGWEAGPLGYPTTDESVTPDGVGRYNHFSKSGSVYWTPSTGAHEVHGAIRAAWAASGWENGSEGYPTSDEYAVPGGRRNNFTKGTITWIAATGATALAH